MTVNTQDLATLGARWRSSQAPGRRRPSRCQAAGCDQATRENKPFCSDHVFHHAYAQKIAAELERQKLEVARARRLGPRGADPAGHTANEILTELRVHGNRTVRRLARDLRLDVPIVEAFVQAMSRKRLVKLCASRRGAGIVKLVG